MPSTLKLALPPWIFILSYGPAIIACQFSRLSLAMNIFFCKGGIEGDKLLWEPTYYKLERLLLLP